MLHAVLGTGYTILNKTKKDGQKFICQRANVLEGDKKNRKIN